MSPGQALNYGWYKIIQIGPGAGQHINPQQIYFTKVKEKKFEKE